MLPKIVTHAKIQVCRATPDGGSVKLDPPEGIKPHPPDTAVEVFDNYDKPYAGACPPKVP